MLHESESLRDGLPAGKLGISAVLDIFVRVGVREAQHSATLGVFQRINFVDLLNQPGPRGNRAGARARGGGLLRIERNVSQHPSISDPPPEFGATKDERPLLGNRRASGESRAASRGGPSFASHQTGFRTSADQSGYFGRRSRGPGRVSPIRRIPFRRHLVRLLMISFVQPGVIP